MSALGGLVHGLSAGLVEPDWPRLTEKEAARALRNFPIDRGRPRLVWHSPRPASASALLETGGLRLFIKRHDARARSQAQLAVEHEFADHLRRSGIEAPRVLRTVSGATSVLGRLGTSGTQAAARVVYEVHELAPGLDLYRDAASWTPYAWLGHAYSAGAALARLHAAAANFGGRRRPMSPLTSSCELVAAADPLARTRELLATRLGLARYLASRPWEADFARYLLPQMGTARPLLRVLKQQWAHGDWHPSNLTWTGPGPAGEVRAVFDLGLANLTSAAHDLAVAIERATVSWLDLESTGTAEADLDTVAALLDGYESVRALRPTEGAALAAVLPVAHLEYALSEVEYFYDVVGNKANADVAYETYLLGHAAWFSSPKGAELTEYLRRRFAG